MSEDGEGGPLLEFLSEPAFVLRRDGEVLAANTAARRLLGADPRGRSLFDFVTSSHAAFDRYLRRCSGTTSPLVDSVVLGTGDDGARTRVYGARLRDGSGEPRLALRCTPGREDEFSVLSARVRDLDLQLRRRLHEKAVLEEALSENRTLLRELQHRVKNNIQMMMSLIYMSARGKDSPEVAEVVEAARMRLHAMASTQEAIHRAQRTRTVAARSFLEELVGSIGQGLEATAHVELRVEDAELSHEVAHAVALITNELVTNAVKHGLGGREGTVEVALEHVEVGLRLTIRDSGPGFDPREVARSSGLRLVRGLCRQIGGALEIENENGAGCVIHFSGCR